MIVIINVMIIVVVYFVMTCACIMYVCIYVCVRVLCAVLYNSNPSEVRRMARFGFVRACA